MTVPANGHPKRNTWTILRENALQIVMYILGTILIVLIWWVL
jgi:hypothetical protein